MVLGLSGGGWKVGSRVLNSAEKKDKKFLSVTKSGGRARERGSAI